MKKAAKPTVAVIFGGKGAEHDISLLGKEYLLRKIDRSRFRALEVFIDRTGEWYLVKGKRQLPVHPIRRGGRAGLLSGRKFHPVSAAFPILHGDFGEDGRVQGLLECIGMPFVGCKTLAGAVSADKCFSKAVAESIGIPTVPWLAVNGKITDGTLTQLEDTLGYPIFVKPARLGSSVGAGIARGRDELYERLRIASELGRERVIAEKCLHRPRELECAFLELEGERLVTPPGEILSNSGFYDFDEKYSSGSSAKISTEAKIPREYSERITEYARLIADALNIEGLSRIDFFLDGENIYFNEINTMPGMTGASLYPALIEKRLPSCDFVNRLISEAVGEEL